MADDDELLDAAAACALIGCSVEFLLSRCRFLPAVVTGADVRVRRGDVAIWRRAFADGDVMFRALRGGGYALRWGAAW